MSKFHMSALSALSACITVCLLRSAYNSAYILYHYVCNASSPHIYYYKDYNSVALVPDLPCSHDIIVMTHILQFFSLHMCNV